MLSAVAPTTPEPLALAPCPLELDTPFHCRVLHATIPVRLCVLRQVANQRNGTRDTWRGQGAKFPSCTPACHQGREVRANAVGEGKITWEGRGPGHMFEPGRRGGIAEQLVARQRLARLGLLSPIPSMDEPPPEEEGDCP